MILTLEFAANKSENRVESGTDLCVCVWKVQYDTDTFSRFRVSTLATDKSDPNSIFFPHITQFVFMTVEQKLVSAKIINSLGAICSYDRFAFHGDGSVFMLYAESATRTTTYTAF